MLYVTTRSNIDTYTSHRAVSTNIAPDGGHFVPFKLKCYTKSEIADLKDKSFNQIIADILNIFFTKHHKTYF
jgi:threonine synthase